MALSTNLIQIEEFEMQAGLTDIYYTTTGGLDNSLIGIYNDHYGVYPVNVEITGSGVNQGLHITYEAQTFDMNVAVLFLKGDLTINNTLTSNSETEALSAKQGKVLKDLIDSIQVTGALSDLDDVDLTSLTGGDILVYDGINQKWVNTAQPSIPSDLNDLDDVTITSPTNGQALVYNNGEWVNGNVSGGGGGVFPDFSNVIQAQTTISGSATYTATEDCFIQYSFIIPGGTASSILTSNSDVLFNMYSSGQLMAYDGIIFIPAGTSITLNGGSSGGSVSKYTVYGVS